MEPHPLAVPLSVLFAFGEEVVVQHLTVGARAVRVHARVASDHAPCPTCQTRSDRIHGSYVRTLADLAWQAKPVCLRLRVRRFVCDAARCPRRTFTEPLPSLALPHARRTRRVDQQVVRVGMAFTPEALPQAPSPAPEVAPPEVPPASRSKGRLPRKAWYEQIHALHRQGLSIHAIVAKVGLSRVTVRKYLRAPTCPTRAPRRTKVGTLTAFDAHLRARWDEDCRDAKVLWRELRERGFLGSYRTIQRHVARWRAADEATAGAGAPSSAPRAKPPSPQ